MSVKKNDPQIKYLKGRFHQKQFKTKSLTILQRFFTLNHS